MVSGPNGFFCFSCSLDTLDSARVGRLEARYSLAFRWRVQILAYIVGRLQLIVYKVSALLDVESE